MYDTKLDERTAKEMIDRIYDRWFVVGYMTGREDEVEYYDDLNLAPIFADMVENTIYANGYNRLYEVEKLDIWLSSWHSHYGTALQSAKAISCIFRDWTAMRWFDLAGWIASGELNEQLEKWGYDFLCMTPLPVDDPDNVSWI